ncbi:putative AMP deaminase [Trypanosoma rangeli]|uniref:Putative AMP deaminase n=1 Tax=Trypanosoma rangeli TaxID=5698 RepID=A0A3R7KMD3_TRYRA|nr:putative AMP deaminase [Trypanosoma rangeli]RNF04511.1 putative AMP deaminase [Trypanosoma rangeli]|eukprot:RNF04511.1 putative AMP deaminase [Trypanosoma rangeli]
MLGWGTCAPCVGQVATLYACQRCHSHGGCSGTKSALRHFPICGTELRRICYLKPIMNAQLEGFYAMDVFGLTREHVIEWCLHDKPVVAVADTNANDPKGRDAKMTVARVVPCITAPSLLLKDSFFSFFLFFFCVLIFSCFSVIVVSFFFD